MSSRASSIDRVIRLALALASAGALALGLTGLAALRTAPSGEHSLARAFGIAVDQMGNIYCGIPEASRIQAYDSEGRFRWATRIDAAWGRFRVRAADGGGVEAATVRNHRVYRLSADGNVVSTTTRPGAYHEFGSENDFSAIGPSGEIYQLGTDAIVVRSPDGTTRTVVGQSWWPYRFRRLPIGFLVAFGVIWAGLAIAWQPAFRHALTQLARIRWG